MRGISICCDTKNANAKPKHMRMRRLTARIEKIEVNAKNADKRNIGQTMTKNFSRMSNSATFMSRHHMNKLGMRVKMALV